MQLVLYVVQFLPFLELKRLFFCGSLAFTISVLLAVVIVTGWMTTIYSNLKDEDTMIGKEAVSVLVVSDVDNTAHNNVIKKLFRWLREAGVVDRVYYVDDDQDGVDAGANIKTWWRRALRDSKVVKDGCVIFFPGPPRAGDLPDREDYRNLLSTQMSLLTASNNLGDKQQSNIKSSGQSTQFSLDAAINQRRLIVVRFPYSDMHDLPDQVHTSY